MIFDDTKDLLQITERTLLELEHGKHKLMNRIADIILFNNMSFICFSGNCNIVIKTLVVAIILFVIGWGIKGFTLVIPSMIMNGVFTFVIATIFCTLTMPSKIVGSDIRSKHIKDVYNIIKKKKLSLSQLQALKNNLSILETAFDAKVKTSKWIIAALWAVFLYMLTKFIIGKTVTLKVALAFLLTMVFIAILYLVTSSFCKTGKRVFMTLSFALNEAISKAKQ